MTPSMPTTPAPGTAAKAATIARAFAIAVGDGVNTSLMDGDLPGVDRDLAQKSVAARFHGLALEAGVVAVVDIDGIERRHLRGSGGGKANGAREQERFGEAAVCVAIGLGADLGGEILRAPGQRGEPRARTGIGRAVEQGNCCLGRQRKNFNVAIRQAGQRFPRRQLRIEMGDRRTALGLRQQDRVGFSRHDGIEIGVDQARRNPGSRAR